MSFIFRFRTYKYLLLDRSHLIKIRQFSVLKNVADLERKRRELLAKGLPKKKPIEGVKHIILVSSGKGGVGKSTISVNLAVALKLLQPNKNVGLLDADVFGPSVPLMMNLHEAPLLTDNNLMKPLVNYGVKCMSIGFLVQEGSPVIWRGLMVMQALDKLMRQVLWGPTDYLIVDTPPGTGDTHLSLVQNLPISGVVLVTTPQKPALQVTKRGAVMYIKLGTPIVGLVDNMNTVKCPTCSSNFDVFGSGTVELAQELGIQVLGKFPINGDISSGSNRGVPIVSGKPDSGEAVLFRELGGKVANFLENEGKAEI